MATTFNKVCILGYLKDKPRKSISNTNITTAILCTYNERVDPMTSYPTKEIQHHKIVLHKKLGDVLKKGSKKGMRIYIEGTIKSKKKINAIGETSHSTYIMVHSLHMIDRDINKNGKNNNDDDSYGNYKNPYDPTLQNF